MAGRVGEVGLMQVRPATAAIFGFKAPRPNQQSPSPTSTMGVTYLARAWRLTQVDLCRALMKYRAGHSDEETTTARSTIYCNRAPSRLS
ncbi:transglycosylase SLT domain-containing protein [Bradyrhizobium sp. 143]|uniref:transglycosylase SLT domain-containing protein n=1 Tax=unclassified Bradyrhizobium TaxID=2631580 RepID=UPI00320AE914